MNDAKEVLGLSARGQFIVRQAMDLFIAKTEQFAKDAKDEGNESEHQSLNLLLVDAQDLLKAIPHVTFEGRLGPAPAQH